METETTPKGELQTWSVDEVAAAVRAALAGEPVDYAYDDAVAAAGGQDVGEARNDNKVAAPPPAQGLFQVRTQEVQAHHVDEQVQEMAVPVVP